MAESIVTFVIDHLDSLLQQEVKLQTGIRKELEGIKKELESIESVLRDSDARTRAENENSNEGIKQWLRDLREVAYCIEDIIDQYVMHVAWRPDERGCAAAFLRRMAWLVKKLKQRHEIASDIEDVKSSISQIKQRKEMYGFKFSDPGESSSGGQRNQWLDPRVSSLFIEEAELVGIEAPRNQLVRYLVEGETRRTVVGVVGMGGVGKTTLATKVYEDERVKARFDSRAWITVSQSFNIEQLLRSLIEQFCKARMEATPSNIDKMEATSLISKLRELSQQRRYLVVCDDVWEVPFGRVVQDAFRDNDNGSRIIISTRNKDVAEFCNSFALVRVHELQPLPPDVAYYLFCKKAFRYTNDGQCTPELKELSFDIAQRCGGLPLAIVAVGALMSAKGVNVFEWQRLYRSLKLELECNPHLTSIKKILAFSYNDLPYHLKFCLLYFGMFPEDYSIRCSRLMRLWMANSFIKEQKDITSEMIAERYLTELIHRSLVQVGTVRSTGKVKTCHVHDLIHEVIVSKSEELSFKQVSIENCSNRNGIARHVFICNEGNDRSKATGKFQSRSILFFEVNQLQNSLIRSLFANFKFLNVLDFEDAPVAHLPVELGNLLYLSYLSVRNTKVSALPKSIGKLHNLETLDLRYSLVSEVPVNISRLSKLKYLLASTIDDMGIEFDFNLILGIKIQGSVGGLEALQKLYHLDMEHASVESISELGKLKQLRKLGIIKLKKGGGFALCEALKKMNHLESLVVTSTSAEEFVQLELSSSPTFPLERLVLCGRLEKLPNWIHQLKNLAIIGLCRSKLMDDPLKVLQSLPNLLDIMLYDAYDGEQLYFEEGCFQKLKSLTLRNMNGLNKVIIEKGALVSLEDLIIGLIPQLKEVPSGIQHLKNLHQLHFLDLAREFTQRLVSNEGPDRSIVEHVPQIDFYYTIGGTCQKMFRLDLDNADLLEFLQS